MALRRAQRVCRDRAHVRRDLDQLLPPRRYSPTPEAWLGPKRYELGAEGITMQGSMSFARYEWAAIRAVEETDAQLLLMLDDLSGLVIPKRCLFGATDLESSGVRLSEPGIRCR